MSRATLAAATAAGAVERRRRQASQPHPQPRGQRHTRAAAAVAAGGGSDGDAALDPAAAPPQGEACPLPAAASAWAVREAPLGGRMIRRLLLQQARHLALAGASLVLCVSMNLLSPVLQGQLFDVLVRGQPFNE